MEELKRCVLIAKSEMCSHSINPGEYRLGMMLEVPSAFFNLSDMLDYIDFISIGTNDLTQYIFAYDREESMQSDILSRAKETLSTIIASVIRIAGPDKNVTVCGEMAADLKVIHSLLRAGIRSLSASPTSIGKISLAIKKIDLSL